MEKIRPQVLYVGPEAVTELVRFCGTNGHQRLLLIADLNTYAALGERVKGALDEAGLDCKLVLLKSTEVIADPEHILEILIAANNEKRTFIAVGSGTITDLARFTSHRTGQAFIGMPTAPSVDGFASIGAPILVQKIKKTIYAQSPLAIFADINTLRQAPRPLLAAGFADMLAKFTSSADFDLGQLLWDEPYDPVISERTRKTAQLCAANVDQIAAATEDGLRVLFDALIESGYCMLDFNESRPASGAEHHVSHYIEMQLLEQGKPAILHGAKVGVATIGMAQLFNAVKQLSQPEVAHALETVELPDREQEEARIRVAYGPQADILIKEQLPFTNMSAVQVDACKQRIIDNWPKIQEIARTVPSPAEITGWIKQVGGPTTPEGLGITEADFEAAYDYGQYLRERFTIRKLAHLFLPQLAL